MDNSLKRLWARRKSKDSDGRKDSGVSSLRKSESTEQTHYSLSTSTSPRSIRNVSSSQGTHQFGPLLNTRAQPTFGEGVASRPSTSRSRAATDGGGSMLSAVNRAGDAIAKAEQEFQHSAERYTREHVRPKTPRYIDIFSLSSSNSPNPRPGFNEDVAERNLDLLRVALEGTHYHYVPSSKYQEEVAARNAHPSLAGSPASSPSVRPQVFDGSQSPGQVRGAASALSSYSRSPQGSGNHSFSRPFHDTPDSPRRHFRQRSDRSGDSQRIHDLVAHGESAASPPHTRILVARKSGSDDLDAAHTLPQVPARHPGRRSGEFQVHEVPADGLSNYQLSASEMTHMKSTEHFTYPHRPDYSMRSPSNLSNASSMTRTINLQHRTIMDLTGDDTAASAKGPRPSTYSSFSAADHVEVDALQRSHRPTVFSPFTEEIHVQSDSHLPATSPPANTAPLIPAQVSQRQHQSPEPGPDIRIDRNPPPSHHFANSFTPIMTIASASPRTSVVMEKSTVPSTAPSTQQDVEVDVSEAMLEDGLASNHMLSGHDELPADESQVAETAVPPSKESTAHVETEIVNSNDVASQRLESMIDRQAYSTYDSEPLSASGPYVHLSAGTIGPVVNASGTSAVITRDFANAATKSPLTSVPEDPELDENSNVPSPTVGTKTRPRKTSSRSMNTNEHTQVDGLDQPTFDEEEFAQKQADAREALVRLQLSLNENFLTQPPPAPIAHSNKSSPSKHIYSFSDGRPAAPSSIFSQIRESSPSPSNPPAEPNESKGAVSNETSYHNLTTVPQKPPVGARSGSLMHSREKAEKKREKGKQRAEMDINGPGPSVMNDPPKQPLPLPPPLHLADDPFVHRFSQPQAAIPPSPGEISLSHFPIPVSSPRQSAQKPIISPSPDRERSISRPASQNAAQYPFPSGNPRILRRKSSTKSQASSTSQFSIPYHMIPDRSSSVRDRSVMEDDL